jgi:hypothetical protein
MTLHTKGCYIMSISDNNGRREKSFLECTSSSKDARAFILMLILLAGGFVFTSSIIATITPMTASFAQEGNSNNTNAGAATTSTKTTASSGMELFDQDQPIYQEQEKLVSQIPINQTHAELIVSVNGTLTLPNENETIRTTSAKSGIVSMMDGTFAGKEILTTEDGSENATAIIYEIVRFNMQSGNGTGIAMALFHTNSTGKLASFDGMILSGHGELYTDRTGLHSLWKWQSGIP